MSPITRLRQNSRQLQVSVKTFSFSYFIGTKELDMTSNNESAKRGKSSKAKTNDEILLGFQKLRGEQRFLTIKLNELDLELHEHRIVIDTLKDLDGDRKCFRMIGGILCERTVKDVLPILKTNEENLVKVVETLNQQLIAKGSEINKYKDEHNVKFKHVDELNDVTENENANGGGSATESTTNTGGGGGGGGRGGGGVLVS